MYMKAQDVETSMPLLTCHLKSIRNIAYKHLGEYLDLSIWFRKNYETVFVIERPVRGRKMFGSADILVCGFMGHSCPVFQELATRKSPEPAGWKACAT